MFTSNVPAPASSAEVSRVSLSASSFSVLDSNTKRRSVVIHNDSSSDVYLKYGTAALTTSYTYKIIAGQHWEMPAFAYIGAIDAIASGATGSLQITELLA